MDRWMDITIACFTVNCIVMPARYM